MPELIICKDSTGQLEGFGEKGRRAWLKFRKVVAGLEPGETMEFSYRLPRSPQHHRFFFARLQALFERQEAFEDVEHLLTFLKVGAGLVDFMPSPRGLVAVPQSIAWVNLDEQQFIEATRAIRDFLWADVAQAALWPHLSEQRRYQMVEQWHREGES